MANDSETPKSNSCVECLAMLIGIGAFIIMVMGAVCLNSGDYDVCGGSRNGAVIMTAIGAAFTGLCALAFIVFFLIACGCICCAIASEVSA